MIGKIKKIQSLPIMERILRFFNSPLFIFIYGAGVLACSFLGFEILFFSLTSIIVIFTAIFSKDSKPLLVPLVLVIYSMSQKHTPQHPYSSNYLYRPYVLISIGVMAVFVLASLIFRLVVYKSEKSILKSKPVAFWGIVALCISLILNGIFYIKYTIFNLLLALILSFSFIFFYVYFFKTLNFNKEIGKYIAIVFSVACAIISLQILETLIFDGVIKNGTIDKHVLNLGWGMSNNAGAMLAIFMPSAFYLFNKIENKVLSRLFYLYGFIIVGVIALTLSRTSLLVAGLALLVIMIIASFKGKDLLFTRIFNIAVIVCALILFFVFFDKFIELFNHYIDKGFDDSERLFIWKNGFINFAKAPIFGVGFYTPIAPDWSYNIENWFFPDMYHNTFIQLLASCGIVGVLAYCFHLFQCGRLLFKKINVERLFYLFVTLILTITCLFDNHIFHVFPALIYSSLFAVAEKDYAEVVGNFKEDVK